MVDRDFHPRRTGQPSPAVGAGFEQRRTMKNRVVLGAALYADDAGLDEA
jgi:hypothetical protein